MINSNTTSQSNSITPIFIDNQSDKNSSSHFPNQQGLVPNNANINFTQNSAFQSQTQKESFSFQDNFSKSCFHTPVKNMNICTNCTLSSQQKDRVQQEYQDNFCINCKNQINQLSCQTTDVSQLSQYLGNCQFTNDDSTPSNFYTADINLKGYMETQNTALCTDDGTNSSLKSEQISTGHLTAKSSGAGIMITQSDNDDINCRSIIKQQTTDEETKGTSEEDSPQPQRNTPSPKRQDQMMCKNSSEKDEEDDQDEEEKAHQQQQEYDNFIDQTQKKTGKASKEDFTLIQVIGTGSYGKVLLVKKKSNGNLYAMKILKKKQLRKLKQVKNTWTERKILEKIDHPYIVKMNCAFQNEKKLFFVLDYCPGGELFFYISQIGRFKESSAKFYAANILLALECLHQNGIIYRDLKPENILIDKDGFAKLTDFGLSKDNFMGDQLANSFCGTAEYLAPEVLNKKGYSYACDWWSFGCVIYEMLSAIPPFYSKKRSEIYDKIRFRNPNFYHYHSANATDLISKLLEKDPNRRLGSQGGSEEIKQHPFFNDIDWEKMINKQLPTPYKPILDSKDDTKHFDQEITNIPIESPPESSFGNQQSDCQESNHDDFDGFSFVAETQLSPQDHYNNSNNLNFTLNINNNKII